MRVIAGSLKGRRLRTPAKDSLEVRPTSDMAREALFDLLQAWPKGAFLDLYGGTGAVAVEAWSRGYAPVTCVERSPGAAGLAAANAEGTGVVLLRRDVRQLKNEAFSDLAVLFADPPYADSPAAWELLKARAAAWLAPGGVLVWETAERDALPGDPGWELVDSRRYGAARFHFLRRAPR